MAEGKRVCMLCMTRAFNAKPRSAIYTPTYYYRASAAPDAPYVTQMARPSHSPPPHTHTCSAHKRKERVENRARELVTEQRAEPGEPGEQASRCLLPWAKKQALCCMLSVAVCVCAVTGVRRLGGMGRVRAGCQARSAHSAD